MKHKYNLAQYIGDRRKAHGARIRDKPEVVGERCRQGCRPAPGRPRIQGAASEEERAKSESSPRRPAGLNQWLTRKTPIGLAESLLPQPMATPESLSNLLLPLRGAGREPAPAGQERCPGGQFGEHFLAEQVVCNRSSNPSQDASWYPGRF